MQIGQCAPLECQEVSLRVMLNMLRQVMEGIVLGSVVTVQKFTRKSSFIVWEKEQHDTTRLK